MRFILKVGMVWHAEPFLRSKLEKTLVILREISSFGIFSDVYFDWAYLEGVPRSDFFSPSDTMFMERLELVERRNGGMDIDTFEACVLSNFRRAFNRLKPVARGCRVAVGLRGSFFDYPAVGLLYVRGTGRERREYSDVELILYNLREGVNDMMEFYNFIRRNHGGRDLAVKMGSFAERLFRLRDSVPVKNILIQSREANVRHDLDATVLSAHNDPRSHFAFVVRFARKKRINREISERERKVLMKLSSFLNYSTIYNKVSGKPEFISSTVRTYSDAGYYSSAGSIIVAATEHDSLFEGYLAYVDRVLGTLLEEFPDGGEFEGWLTSGLRKLRSE